MWMSCDIAVTFSSSTVSRQILRSVALPRLAYILLGDYFYDSEHYHPSPGIQQHLPTGSDSCLLVREPGASDRDWVTLCLPQIGKKKEHSV